MNNFEVIQRMTLEQMATLTFFAFGTKDKEGHGKAFLVGLDGNCYKSAVEVYEANLAFLKADAKEPQPTESLLGAMEGVLKKIVEDTEKRI